MTTRLIENILEAEAIAEEMRNSPKIFYITNLSEEITKEMMMAKPGAVIRVPRDWHCQPIPVTYAISF